MGMAFGHRGPFPGDLICVTLTFPGSSDGKESPCIEGYLGSIPGLGRSPGEGNDYPLQYSCLENPQGQRSLAGCSPCVCRVRHDWATSLSTFSTVQLSQPYVTTGKTIALTMWTFVGRVVSLLFNTLPRLVMAFLPRSKCFLTSWLQSPSAVILEPKKRKSVTTSIFYPSMWHKVMGPDAMNLVSLIFSFKPALS